MNSDATPPAIALLQEIWSALGGTADAAADVAIEPGTQDVGASLTVTFAIG